MKQTEAPDRRAYRQEWSRTAQAVREDVQGFINFGAPIGVVHLGIWTIARLQTDAGLTQARLADVFGVPATDVGIWLGRDKLCAAEGFGMNMPQGRDAGLVSRHKRALAEL